MLIRPFSKIGVHRMSGEKPKCPKCGTGGDVVEAVQSFYCGLVIDGVVEIFPCKFYDEPEGGPEDSMTPPSQHPYLR